MHSSTKPLLNNKLSRSEKNMKQTISPIPLAGVPY